MRSRADLGVTGRGASHSASAPGAIENDHRRPEKLNLRIAGNERKLARESLGVTYVIGVHAGEEWPGRSIQKLVEPLRQSLAAAAFYELDPPILVR